MLNEFPNLLLSDCLTPITNEIGFLDLPFEQALEAYLDWQRPIRRKYAEVTTRDIPGDLETILHALEPMRTIQENRTALIPTLANWTAFFDNRDVGPDLIGTMHVLADRTGRQTLMVSVTLTEIDGVPRQTTMLDMTQFVLYGPSMRSLRAWINHSDRWTWDVSGEVQQFERPDLYKTRRIKDRLTIETMTEYAAVLGLRPFDADFYAPDGFGAIVELDWLKSSDAREISLDQVQARLARGWHNPSSYEGL